MSQLVLDLLGQFQVQLDNHPLTAFESDKGRALLAYLAVEADRAHQRSSLAALLWPGYLEESARTTLRNVLHQLRLTIGDTAASEPFLLVTRQTLQFNPAADYRLDVATFRDLLHQYAIHSHPHLAQCPACLERLRQAVALYHGDFLAGLTVQDSAGFEEWRRITQEQLHIQAVDALQQLASAFEINGDHEQTHYYALRQVQLEPWREEGHRQLMRALAQRGQRSAAIAQYHTCRQVLAAELGVEPDAETTALYEQIRAGKLDKVTRWQDDKEQGARSKGRGNEDEETQELQSKIQNPKSKIKSPPHPVTWSPLYDWGEMPAVDSFHGRSAELVQLESWLVEGLDAARLSGRAQVVTVLGIGGVGKTTLAATVVKMVASTFDTVIWRSLLNAPPLTEILRSWLQILARQTLTELPGSLDEQLRLLVDYLRQQRALLVLDNLESILQSGAQAGEMRPGYEDYAQLLQRLHTVEHSSCLLLTSREQPQALVQIQQPLRDSSGRVRTRPLAGLDAQAGHAILQGNGLAASYAEASTLVQHYSGNPLALQLVANTIVDLFRGDVAAFQHEAGFIFEGVRTVLDQQLARLTPLEREILVWLALEREAISVPMLRSNLVQAPSAVELMEALRALQRRSLLEQVGDGFSLQNVVIEYLTEYLVDQVYQEIFDLRFAIEEDGLLDPGSSIFNPQSSILNRFALLKAQAKAYVRQSQERLILQPIGARLVGKFGQVALVSQVKRILEALRTRGSIVGRGYAAGNLLNLLLHLEVDLSGYDFSHLAVWQAFLHSAYLPNLNFAGADLAGSAFTQSFGKIDMLDFGSNGELVVIGVEEGRLCVWRVTTGELLQECPLPGIRPGQVSWSDDRRLAAVTDANDGVHLFDLTSGHPLQHCRGHSNPIWRLCFSPDGKTVVSGDTSGLICVWHVQSGQLIHTLHGHSDAITALAWAPDGDMFASAAVNGLVCLWNPVSGERLHTLHEHLDEVAAAVFALGGAILATGGHDGTIRLWDVQSGQCRQVLHRHQRVVRILAITSAGHTLASCGGDPFIYLWDVRTGEALHVLTDHAAAIYHLVFSPDDQTLAAFDANNTIRLWSVQRGQQLDSYRVYSNMFHTVDFSPAGKQIVAGGGDQVVYVWDVTLPERAQLVARLPGHAHHVATTIFSPDGETIASGDFGGTIHLWNVRTRAVRVLLGHTGAITALTFSPDGNQLISSSGDHTLGVWAVYSGQRTRVLQGHTNSVTTCSISPSGQWIASGSLDQTLCIWDATTGERLHTLRGHTNAIQQVLFHPDGQHVFSSSYDQTVRLWELPSGQLLATWPSPNTVLKALAIHPAGAVVAAGGQDHLIRLIALRSGQVLGTLRGHRGGIDALKFSPDGRMLASASRDETIQLWEIDAAAGLGRARQLLRAPGPYLGMNIAGVTGISEAQKVALKALGAVEEMDKEQEAGGEEELQSKIQNPKSPIGSPPLPIPLSAVHDWGEIPETGRVYGRQAELAQLTTWLRQEQCQVVAVLGIGGVGKTTLAATAVQAVATAFDTVIWRSLLNTPPLDELLRGVLPGIARQQLVEFPSSLDEQLLLLLHHLQQQRCLLVLDNLESILQAEGTGQMRPGYEGYAQLIQRLAESRHQSCLLLTSRERPQGLARWEEDLPRVRTVRLEGVDASAGQSILTARGLTGQAPEIDALVRRYSGHPLALKLVAETVQELFGGVISDFLHEEAPIFDDIRSMLDQQFARLSALEQEILFWLAIEREAISASALRATLVQKETSRTFLEALRSLQRRSLLETAADCFTLQNVVIEYVTERLIDGVCAELSDKMTRWQDDKMRVVPEHPVILSSGHAVTLSFFNRFALVKAQGKEYVRQSQVRLILQPIGERLVTKLGKSGLVQELKRILTLLRTEAPLVPGYAGGNILNLLLHLDIDVTGYDFSQQSIWQAYLCDQTLANVNFAHADLTGSTFTNPFNSIWSVAYSPDGQFIAGGSLEGTVYLWRAVEGGGPVGAVGMYAGHTALVHAVAFSPDGQLLASASEDKTVRVWDIQSGQLLYMLRGYTKNVFSVAFSPDGELLASGSGDATVRLCETHTGKLVQILHGHERRVNQVVFSADGAWLASCSDDYSVRVWRLPTAELVHILHSPQDRLYTVEFSPDGALLVSGGEQHKLYLWETQTWQLIQTLTGHKDYIKSVAFSPDGKLLVSASADNTLRLWDVAVSQCVRVLQGHQDRIWSVDFHPQGAALVSGSWDGTVRVWEVATGQLLQMLNGYTCPASALVFDADDTVWVGTVDNIQVRLWDATTTVPRQPFRAHTLPIRKIAFGAADASGKQTLLSGGFDQIVNVWDAQQGVLRKCLRGHSGRVDALTVSPSGKLFASAATDQTIRIWDAASGQSVHLLQGHPETIWSLAFDPTDTILASGGAPTIYLWDVAAGKCLAELVGHTLCCQFLVFSPDGNILASAGEDQRICLWEVGGSTVDKPVGGQLVQTLIHNGTVYALAFSSDGRLLVSGSNKNTLCLWDVQRGALIREMEGHATWVMSVAFNQADTLIASGSLDGTVKIWDVQTGLCLQTVRAQGPYTGMNITGVTGISDAQKVALKALGAVDEN